MHTTINAVLQFSSNRKRRRSSKSPIEPWSGDNLGALDPSAAGREPGRFSRRRLQNRHHFLRAIGSPAISSCWPLKSSCAGRIVALDERTTVAKLSTPVRSPRKGSG
jgi:hypothetical protein